MVRPSGTCWALIGPFGCYTWVEISSPYPPLAVRASSKVQAGDLESSFKGLLKIAAPRCTPSLHGSVADMNATPAVPPANSTEQWFNCSGSSEGVEITHEVCATALSPSRNYLSDTCTMA